MAKPNELYHHGVMGMKWGKKNGPPYPLDAQGKAQLREQKKIENKKIKEETKKITFKDYDDQDKHRLAKNTAIGTVIGGPVLGIAVGLITDNSIRKGKAIANLYSDKKVSSLKVPSEKELQSIFEGHRESFSTDERKDLWESATNNANNPKLTQQQRENAKQLANRIEQVEKSEKTYKSPNKGLYDLDFLEAIQNSEMLAIGDHKSMDAEYEKFKEDPEYYWKHRSDKLRQI